MPVTDTNTNEENASELEFLTNRNHFFVLMKRWSAASEVKTNKQKKNHETHTYIYKQTNKCKYSTWFIVCVWVLFIYECVCVWICYCINVYNAWKIYWSMFVSPVKCMHYTVVVFHWRHYFRGISGILLNCLFYTFVHRKFGKVSYVYV